MPDSWETLWAKQAPARGESAPPKAAPAKKMPQKSKKATKKK